MKDGKSVSKEDLHRFRLLPRSTPGVLIMAGMFIFAISMFASFILRAQELTHAVSVINVEIPIRVYRAGIFVDSLTIKDFEVFDNNEIQDIQAVYLIKGTTIKREEIAPREEAKKAARPQVSRQFALFFEMSDYLPELDKTLDYFFDKVIFPGDSLIVLTPMKNYNLRSDALAQKPKDKVKEELRGVLRRDILVGGSEYRNTIADMRRTLASPGTGVEMKDSHGEMDQKLWEYALLLSKLESLRHVNEKGLLDFAAYLKKLPGQKFVYMFYQKEMIPQFSPLALMNNEMQYQGDPSVSLQLLEMFELFNRNIGINVDAVNKAYADSSITIHFLFLTKTPAVRNDVEYFVDAKDVGQISSVEHSEDIYGAFGDVARATGGIVDSSGNAAAAFARAVTASENYYLIYYKPNKYVADGSFHELKVKVTTGSYQVAHRAGYWAK
jgi:hypothetical protein